MNNIIKRVWNQNRMVNIEDLCGMAFQAESGGHTFEISGVDDTGATVNLSGTVTGVFRRPDNADIALTGSASGGVASVTLTDDCYAVPGRFGLVIYVTSNSQKVAVYSCVGTVAQTNGGAVAGDTPQDVVDLINAIEAAVATIPADYTDLMTAIAPTYSNTALYPFGKYAWNNGKLYRCIVPITTAETWTAAHWVLASLGDDVSYLKTNIRDVYGVNLFNCEVVSKNIFLNGTTGAEETNLNYNASDFIPVTGGSKYTIKTFDYSGNPSYRIYYYNSSKGFISRNVDRVSNSPNGYKFTASSNCAYIRLNFETQTNAGGYQNEETCVLVRGETTISAFIPYYTAYDRTAREAVNSLSVKAFTRNSNVGITDANDVGDIGFVYVSSTNVSNLPESGAWYLWTVYLDANNKLQLAYNAHGTNPYIRSQVNGTWGNWERVGKEAVNEEYVTSSMAMFPTVGCCGDSFTAGYLYNKPDSQYYDPNYVPNGEYPDIGYPAVMGRLYGVDVTAYAKGGLTSTEYRTDAKGLPALLADDPKYLYIIALGLNDKTQNVPLGVEADIDTEPATPSYLGNMGAIIRAIQSHAPYARIILCKSLWVKNAGATAYNSYYQYISEGVELLSSHLGIPYIETLDDPYFCSDAYVNGLKGLHPTAPLYAGMGKRIGELVGKCVIDNPNYFYNFYVPNA